MTRVVAAVIEDGKRGVLICQRPQGQAFAGKWEFPGGKMRAGETPRAALQRELREELGIEARVGSVIHRVRHRYPGMAQTLELNFFSATLRFGQPRNICFARIRWVSRGELPAYDFLEADTRLVAELARGRWRRK